MFFRQSGTEQDLRENALSDDFHNGFKFGSGEISDQGSTTTLLLEGESLKPRNGNKKCDIHSVLPKLFYQ